MMGVGGEESRGGKERMRKTRDTGRERERGNCWVEVWPLGEGERHRVGRVGVVARTGGGGMHRWQDGQVNR